MKKIKEIIVRYLDSDDTFKDYIIKLDKNCDCEYCKSHLSKGENVFKWNIDNNRFDIICLNCGLNIFYEMIEECKESGDTYIFNEDLKRFKKDYAKELIIGEL